MPWPTITLRQRREQVRDDIDAHVPAADARTPNAVLSVMAEAQASLTHDNDRHLDWVARMMMPDTAEGEFVDRWANIWLPAGRKPATAAGGNITATGDAGAAIPTGAILTAFAIGDDGEQIELQFEVVQGLTLSASSGVVAVRGLTPGAASNIAAGAQLSWLVVPDGLDGQVTVAAGGLTGGADAETDTALIERYIARIQEPPRGGAAHDYVAWMLEVPGVTRAWATQDMGIGTITCRFMMDDVRADQNGIPTSGDVATVAAFIDLKRPVTVADRFVVAPIATALDFTITNLSEDTPELRANIDTEIAAMLAARSAPGQTIYASWVSEAISIASGEDRHDLSISNVVPASSGHIIVPGTITYG